MSSLGKLAGLVSIACVLMAQTSVDKQIKQLPSPDQSSVLAAKLLHEARAPAISIVEVWLRGDPASREKARAVLNDMEEAALNPLWNVKTPLAPEDQVWRMTMVVETVGDLRRSAAGMLAQQLSNKQPAPVPTAEGVEEREPPRRVCDEAYMLMSRLVANDPQSEDFLLRMRQFVHLPEARRDAEIQRARQSVVWRQLRTD